MKRWKNGILGVLTLGLILTGLGIYQAESRDVPRMSSEELKAKLGDPGIVIIDVRQEGDWKSSDSKIEGAVREDPNDVAAWMKQFPKDKTLVFYCA